MFKKFFFLNNTFYSIITSKDTVANDRFLLFKVVLLELLPSSVWTLISAIYKIFIIIINTLGYEVFTRSLFNVCINTLSILLLPFNLALMVLTT